MIKTSILIEDDGLTAILQKLEQQFGQAGIAAINEEAGRRIGEKIVIRYPEQTRAPLPEIYDWGDGKLHKFPSIGAQRGFFRALKENKIRVPYWPQTGTLARSGEFAVYIQGYEATVRIFIPDDSKAGKYAKYVLGTRQQQSRYFRTRTNWKPLTFIIEEQEPEITSLVKVTYENIAKEFGID